MMGAIAMPLLATPRLMKPTAKMETRMLRNAIEQVAKAEGLDFMTLEETYSNVRSALAHLMAHDRFRTNIEDRIGELVQKTEELLACPGVERLSRKKNWTTKLAQASAGLDDARKEMLTASSMTPKDIARFLKVVEVNREAHLAEHCDPSEIISAPLYTLAHMVAGNFDAYHKTLNT